MSNSVIMGVTATPDPAHPEALEEYTAIGPTQLVAAGAVPKFRARLVERLAGEGPANMVFVAEFESLEAAQSAFQTESYKAALPYRDKAFSQRDIMLMEAI